METNKEAKKWYLKWWIVIFIFPILIMLWLTRLIWRQKWKKLYRIAVIVFLWFMAFSFSMSLSYTNKQLETLSSEQKVLTNDQSPDQTISNVSNTTPKNVTDKITDLIEKEYPGFTVTIFKKDLELASEGEVPYDVIINGAFNEPLVSDCDDAKRTTYYMLETLYMDDEIRPTLDRVKITIPWYIKVSLGASDGVPMAEKDMFSGPTNFWTVMEQMGLGENETGEMKNRTWGEYITRCQQ